MFFRLSTTLYLKIRLVIGRNETKPKSGPLGYVLSVCWVLLTVSLSSVQDQSDDIWCFSDFKQSLILYLETAGRREKEIKRSASGVSTYSIQGALGDFRQLCCISQKRLIVVIKG